jgi:hypothetical protein
MPRNSCRISRSRLAVACFLAQLIDPVPGHFGSSTAPRQALIDQHQGCILATNERDEATLAPQEGLNGYTGQAHAARGFRFLKDPQRLATSRDLKQPERIMALVMVMTVCWLVYAACEYRIRQALKDHNATLPNPKGQPVQNPTAGWVFQYFGGIHVLRIPGPWDPLVVHLTEPHQQLRERLGQSYTRFYR